MLTGSWMGWSWFMSSVHLAQIIVLFWSFDWFIRGFRFATKGRSAVGWFKQGYKGHGSFQGILKLFYRQEKVIKILKGMDFFLI